MPDISTAQIAEQTLCQDGRVSLVALTTRIAAPALIAAIEWYWYAPSTSRNRLFDLYGCQWAGLHWTITRFPRGRLPAVRRLAEQLALRVVDGAPMVAGYTPIITNFSLRPSRLKSVPLPTTSNLQMFPGAMLPNGKDNELMFTVEYDHDSPVYKNRVSDEEGMQQASNEINSVLNRGIKLTPHEIADYIYGSTYPKS